MTTLWFSASFYSYIYIHLLHFFAFFFFSFHTFSSFDLGGGVVPFSYLSLDLISVIVGLKYKNARVGIYVFSLSNHTKYRSVFYLTSSSLDINYVDQITYLAMAQSELLEALFLSLIHI